MQKDFCGCYLAFSNCHMCSNCMPKRDNVENKACDYHMPKLNVVCTDMWTCDYMARPKWQNGGTFNFKLLVPFGKVDLSGFKSRIKRHLLTVGSF